MAIKPVPGTARISWLLRLHGSQVVNTLHVTGPDLQTGEGLTTLAQAARDAYVANVLPTLSSQLVLEGVNALDLNSALGPSVSLPAGLVAGGIGQPSHPSNVAFCITLQTTARGRSGRGRMYLAGIRQDAGPNSTVDPQTRTSLVVGVTDLVADLASVGYQAVLVSRYGGKAERPVPLVLPIVAVRSVDAVLDSQRRRLPGRGS